MRNLLFYYPQHFNRSKECTNPFFDRMLEICDRHGISYGIIEEPDKATDKRRNPRARKGDVFFWTVTVIRKCVSKLFPSKNFYAKEKIVARIINSITLGRYKYRNYITISGSMYHLFANINPDASVFDMQHGVLYKDHPTFFEHKRLRRQYYPSNLHFLFWGKGYHDIFINGDEEVLSNRTHVIGYPIAEHNSLKSISPKRNIIVSLQFTNDIVPEERAIDKKALDTFLAETEASGYQVLLKHHPRYNNCIDIDDLLKRYEHVQLTNLPLSELISEVCLHVTYFSTTAFEFAAYGIPTYFIPSYGRPAMYGIFYNEYDYPLYNGMSIMEVLHRAGDDKLLCSDAQTVKQWYNRFYSPFDEQAFLELIK